MLCSATLFGSHQGHLPPSVWQSLAKFCLLTSVRIATPGNKTKYKIQGGYTKTPT